MTQCSCQSGHRSPIGNRN